MSFWARLFALGSAFLLFALLSVPATFIAIKLWGVSSETSSALPIIQTLTGRDASEAFNLVLLLTFGATALFSGLGAWSLANEYVPPTDVRRIRSVLWQIGYVYLIAFGAWAIGALLLQRVFPEVPYQVSKWTAGFVFSLILSNADAWEDTTRAFRPVAALVLSAALPGLVFRLSRDTIFAMKDPPFAHVFRSGLVRRGPKLLSSKEAQKRAERLDR